MLGCTLKALKPCACPASRPKKKPWVSDRDISGLVDGSAYKWSWSRTPPCAADSRQDMQADFAPGGRGRWPLTWAIDIKWAHQLPETILSAIIKRIIQSSERNRHWSSEGCTESKRTAILNGLTIQPPNLDGWSLVFLFERAATNTATNASDRCSLLYVMVISMYKFMAVN